MANKQTKMKAKDKARRLVETYTIKLPPQSAINLDGYSVNTQGKLIASMVAKEIRKAVEGHCNLVEITYWDNVLDEIELL